MKRNGDETDIKRHFLKHNIQTQFHKHTLHKQDMEGKSFHLYILLYIIFFYSIIYSFAIYIFFCYFLEHEKRFKNLMAVRYFIPGSYYAITFIIAIFS